MRHLIVAVASGKVELVFDGQETTVQFNCSCLDALPYCNAMCCRLRDYYNVTVDPDEESRFVTEMVQGVRVLMVDPDRKCCAYLTGHNTCGVHEEKPRGCLQWHCSPGGVGEGVTQRGHGWTLLPSKG